MADKGREEKNMEELLNIRTYREFKAATDREVLNQAEGFVRLGYLLRKARDTEILRDSGYPSVVAFAEGEYGLTETYVSRYIAINKRYSQDGYSPYLKERFQGYGMAKLAEMLTLSDEVVEALPPELSRADIQEVKREIRQEQEITDLEVMLEKAELADAEDETEEKSNLEKWMEVYIRENEEEWGRAKKTMSEAEQEDWVMDFLAPTGIAAKMARIKGEGKWMLTIKGRYLPLELLNLRTNEKEVYSLKDCAEVMARIRMQEEEQEQKQIQAKQEKEREGQERKLAPVQETDAGKFKPEEKKEPQNTVEQEIKEPAEQEIKEVGEVWEEERQMEVEDYPEILPEGYTPASYIKCHDGSEVEEKEWRKAKELIGGLYEDIAREDWNLGEVYQKAKKLLAILEKLKKEEGKEGGPLCR